MYISVRSFNRKQQERLKRPLAVLRIYKEHHIQKPKRYINRLLTSHKNTKQQNQIILVQYVVQSNRYMVFQVRPEQENVRVALHSDKCKFNKATMESSVQSFWHHHNNLRKFSCRKQHVQFSTISPIWLSRTATR